MHSDNDIGMQVLFENVYGEVIKDSTIYEDVAVEAHRWKESRNRNR